MSEMTDELVWGTGMVALLADLAARGVARKVVLVRHSAREFVPGRHDLLNPLTDEGRAGARAFGAALPAGFRWRGYASPAERCQETASLALAAHAARGGEVARMRPVEGLGVFYALDQMKMFRTMQAAGGLGPVLARWVAGEVGHDVMLDAALAAAAVGRLMNTKLDELHAAATPGADLLVSHDMTLGLVRDRLLGQSWEAAGPVAFLDGIVAWREGGETLLQSPHGGPVVLRG